MSLSITDLMERMPAVFKPEKAQGVDAAIQFHFTGDDASDWSVTIRDGTCKAVEGVHDDPTIALTADSQDFIDVVTGKSDAMSAFLQGKLKLKGDPNLAMRMVDFFDLSS